MALRVMRRVAVISVLALVLGLAGGVSAHPMDFAQTAPETWTVLVGGQGEMQQQEMGMMGAWQFMRFYPETITVNVGDTVMWKLNSGELHSVNFPKVGDKGPDLILMEGNSTPPRVLFNPLAVLPQGGPTFDGTAPAGAGQMGGGSQFPTEWKLTFTKPGTYDYICAFHPMMTGKVIVQAPGAAYPKTQAQVDADTKAQLDADVAAAMKMEATIKPPMADPKPDGTSILKVNIGSGDGTLTWMRFNPTNLTIHVGDTVQWTQTDPMAPHTITFISSDAKEPDLVLPEPQQAGPPKLVLNPEMIFPVGSATYSGKGYTTSGFLWGTKDPTPGPREYSLTFDTPGTYKYVCVLHDDMGMMGQITVLPKGAKS